MTTPEFIGFKRDKYDRRDPIAKVALDMANAIRMRHGCSTLGNPSNVACYMGWDAYRTMWDRHEREHPSPPTPPAISKAMDEAASAPIDPNDPRLVRLRELISKRLPPKLRARFLAGELAPW